MEREVKFRALDKNNLLGSQIGFLPGDCVIVEWDDLKQQIWKRVANNKDIILMQFTGLTDKNGIEIYERDIVNAKLVGEFKGPIVYNRGSFKIDSGRDINNRPYIYLEDWCQTNYRTVEIIGNIYKNPELLEVKE